MSNKQQHCNGCTRTGGCGCTSSFFVDMIENAGAELSRRDFVKGVAVAGGMLAAGGLAVPAYASANAADPDAGSDTIYHGGSILTMAKDGDRAEALATRGGQGLKPLGFEL